MKIAYIISSLDVGGAQTMLLKLITEYMNDKNNQIKIFVKSNRSGSFIESELEKIGVEIYYLQHKNKKSIIKITSYLKFLLEIKKFNPNVIHSHLENNLSLLYAIFMHKKIIVTIHSWPNRFLNGKIRKLYIKLIRKKLIYVVCCAKCVQDEFSKIVNIPSEMITTIYNPIDIDKFEHIDNNSNNLFNILHIGRLTSIKNQKLLIDAFSESLKYDNKIHLNIVGDGELREDLINYTKSLKIENKVSFFGQQENVNKFLLNSKVFILTSKSECCPIVLLEAMASGLPMISTNVGGTAEIIGNTGILCEQDKKCISSAILTLKNDLKLYDLYRNNCKSRIKLFDVKKISCDYYNVYKHFNNYSCERR